VVRAGGVGGINKAGGLPWFLLTAVLAGFAALLTPCVFPMVPITISFFNKQAEKEHHRPITMASVYCLGIIGTFTILGVVMSALCGAASLNQLATGAWMNIFLSIVLGFFGLSLLGMYEIRMPSWLLTATSGQQGRGGYLGVLFMALTFTLTSFTCTFAFAGGLLVAAAQGDRLWPVLGLLAFSAAFSLPFFFLALFPSLLQKLPRSGGWMNVVKVVMGMVEIGAAFKFLSVADVAWNGVPTLFDYELVLASWMVISLMTGAYLLGLYRLPHDIEASSIGVPRLLGAMSFVGLAVYISIGLFSSHKPSGALWENIVAFAPQKIDHSAVEDGPRPEGPFLVHGGLSYSLDVQKAVEFAVKANRPLFVEFTGQTCTNCRRMEIGAMNRPDAKDRLSKFVRVQLYTDSVPEVADKKEAKRLADLNRKLQQEWFGDTTLPAYGIVTAKPQVLKDPNAFLNDFYGMEQSRGEFTNFLEVGLNRWKEIQTRKVKEVTASKDSQTRAQLSSAANQPEKNVVDNR
jgi:thiol:disulfide interchange protein DsbD